MRIAAHCWSATVTILFLSTLSASAEEASIQEVKRLYASASFENALAVLERFDRTVSSEPDVLEYRALCLLALGRSMEAQSVADMLVSAAPTFLPSSGEDVSPRFVALLTDTRRRLLPEIAKRTFTDAREQFRARNQDAARNQFEQVLLLANDPVWSDQAAAEDLKTLASGFLDLMVTPAAVPSATLPTSSPAPAPSSRAPARSTNKDQISGNAGFSPPVPLTQTMPKWRPRDLVTAQRNYRGAVRVRIGADGHVVNAAIEVATHPDYDKLLLDAARTWTYKPATRNGDAVEVDKLVTFSLKTY